MEQIRYNTSLEEETYFCLHSFDNLYQGNTYTFYTKPGVNTIPNFLSQKNTEVTTMKFTANFDSILNNKLLNIDVSKMCTNQIRELLIQNNSTIRFNHIDNYPPEMLWTMPFEWIERWEGGSEYVLK